MKLVNDIKWSPFEYANAAVIAKEAGCEMLSRLDWMTKKPKIVLDAGCGTGDMSTLLAERYPEAKILACDLSQAMLEYAKQKPAATFLCADASHLPLRNQTVDLIFANFILPWQVDFKLMLREWLRVLSADGLLIFTMLGLDTLKEFQSRFAQDMPQLIDMHDVGDLLLQEGFADPVLDVDYYTTVYRDINCLLHELHSSGMWFSNEAFNIDVIAPQEKYEATYEIIYAHAFIPANRVSKDGEVRVSVDKLRQMLRQGT